MEKPASEGRLKQPERYFDHINGREKHKFYCCFTFTRTNEVKPNQARLKNGLYDKADMKFMARSPLQSCFVFLDQIGGQRLASLARAVD